MSMATKDLPAGRVFWSLQHKTLHIKRGIIRSERIEKGFYCCGLVLHILTKNKNKNKLIGPEESH